MCQVILFPKFGAIPWNISQVMAKKPKSDDFFWISFRQSAKKMLPHPMLFLPVDPPSPSSMLDWALLWALPYEFPTLKDGEWGRVTTIK